MRGSRGDRVAQEGEDLDLLSGLFSFFFQGFLP